MRQNKTKKGGFTLFGVLLYIALTSVLLVAISELTMTVLVAGARAQDEQSVIYALSFLDINLGVDIGSADSVSAPTVGVPSTDLVLVHTGVISRYFVEDERLWVVRESGQPEPLTPVEVVIQSSEFRVGAEDTGTVQWQVRTGTRNPLRAQHSSMHATTTLTWYPYVYE